MAFSRHALVPARLLARFDAFAAAPTPRLGVEFAAGRIVVGTSGAALGKKQPAKPASGLRAAVRALAPEAIVPSAVRQNVADPEALATQLRTLLERYDAIGAEATLLVPDLTARISVLDFDTLPSRREELEPLARFRLRKSLPFAEEQAVISCQLLSPTRMLVAIAERARLDEYENCLEAAGAHAATVIPSGLACLAAQPVLDHGALLIRAEAGSLTTAFCWREKVEFFRAIETGAEATFEDVFPSVAFFRDRAEASGETGGEWILYAAGLQPELEARLRDEISWASLRPAAVVTVEAAAGDDTTPAHELLAVAGALRGRFL